MKKLLAGFITICLILVLFVGSFGTRASVSADTSGPYQYILSGGKATITKYTGVKGVVVIPNTLGGQPVTSIGGSAFSACDTLTRVIIPDSVTSIGDRAFYNCLGLTRVTLGSGVTSIGELAFGRCMALTAVYARGKAPTMKANVFDFCAPGFKIYPPDQNNGSKIILFSMIFLLALIISFWLIFVLRRQAKRKRGEVKNEEKG